MSPDVKQLEDELGTLRAQYAEAMLLLGLVEQARDFGHVHELLAEFRRPPDFPAHKNGEHR